MTNVSGDKWVTGDAYEAYMGRWSRPLARVFVEWLHPKPSAHWLEVGCGTGAQKVQAIDYFSTVRQPFQKKYIEQFQRNVPHARIVEIPRGHHYCFIKQQELVFDAMTKFLLE